MRESIVLYKNLREATKQLDLETRAKVYDAVMDYAFDGIEPTESGVVQAMFLMMKPIIDINNQRYENGCKGGRPKNQTETKTKPKENQIETKAEPNDNVNDNVNVNVNVNENENENVNVNGTDAETTRTTAATAESTSCSAEKGVEAKKSRDAGSKVSFGYTSDKKLHGIDEQLLSYWQEQFPEVNVPQELRNAEAWLESNPVPRKKNIRSFLLNWLIRSQKQVFEKSAPVSSYTRLDGNTPEKVSAEERKAFDGF